MLHNTYEKSRVTFFQKTVKRTQFAINASISAQFAMHFFSVPTS